MCSFNLLHRKTSAHEACLMGLTCVRVTKNLKRQTARFRQIRAVKQESIPSASRREKDERRSETGLGDSETLDEHRLMSQVSAYGRQ
jgi:hypothetical protein